MGTYTYSIDIYIRQRQGKPASLHSTATGQVEAERYSHACVKSWDPIHAECERVRQETGGMTGVGDLRVERKS